MRHRKLLLFLGCLAVGYLGGYALVRTRHVIVHTSNYRHWHPEKRSPGHHVGSDLCVRPSERAVSFLFKPLRVLEEEFHNAVH